MEQNEMEQDEIQKNLDDMIENIITINRIPSNDTEPPSKKSIKEFAKSYISTMTLKERFDFLRLHIKYTVFDLEATRRENQHLKNFIRNDNNA